MDVRGNNIARDGTLAAKDKKLQHEQAESAAATRSCPQEELVKCREECSNLEEKCHELELERDEAREEVRGLEREIDELQDSFKEEESEQFEQLKQELELANKNCKILQIRLAKADRQYGQLEQVKISLERQLSEWTSSQQVNPFVASSKNDTRLIEEDERVRDLQEQVRYSQEEAQLKGERLSAVEQENEMLLARISNLTTANSRLRVKSQASGELDQNSLFNLETLIEQNEQLKLALEMSAADTERLRRKCNDLSKLDDASSQLETDLVNGLRKQLETAESELARAKGRLVELDRENGRLQSQYKQLLESIESCRSISVRQRKLQLPVGAARDSMGRQELREALAKLEEENEHLFMALQMKDKCSSNFEVLSAGGQTTSSGSGVGLEERKSTTEGLEQRIEKLLSSNEALETRLKLLERERVSTEEEVEKLRQFNEELRAEKRELTGKLQSLGNRCREHQLSCERLRAELADAQKLSATSCAESAADSDPSRPGEPALLARDLSELRIRNAFLMRQLELARDDSARELEEERKSQEVQRKRAVELALIEMREKNLADCQLLRDELAELKERLTTCQRDLGRAQDELEGERERTRTGAREWRREKGQLQKRQEELEAQLGLERRASEIRLKELDSGQRDKQRELTNVQERCLQVERELKRAQNKHHSYLESSESQIKSLTRELEAKRRELAELSSSSQVCADKNYELTKRFNQERAALVETLETMKRSYEENLGELERVRDRLSKRQQQLFQERQISQKRIDELGADLCKATERQFQARADREMLEASEKRLESLKTELARVKEERQRLRSRLADLENRCLKYEKQELANKTSSILSVKQPLFGATSRFASAHKQPSATIDIPAAVSSAKSGPPAAASSGQTAPPEDANMLEKLASKIKDQRHLTDTLRARNEQLEGELRQSRMMYSIERSKWLTKETLLRSRVNDCEERLMIESSLLSGNALDSIKECIEVQWDRERRQSMDTICQQQTQLESLSRDFRRLSQAHEFLKLQVRQLEDNNRKLASRLMEGEYHAAHSQRGHRQSLLAEQARLINEDARPLLNLVTKILEATEKGRRSATTGSEKSNISKSSERPLIASKGTGSPAADQLQPPPSPATTSKTSTVKRLKPKSSSLGLSASEKQQLRQHLENLSSTLDELDTPVAPTPSRLPSSTQRAFSELNTRVQTPVNSRSSQADNERAQYRASSMDRAFQWLDTSDGDSESPSLRRLSYNAPATIGDKRNSAKLSSLTDYESESSLMSELSCPTSSLLNSADQIGSQKSKRKSVGLKNRFTNTLRSISRSISALTSDSESEKPPEVMKVSAKKRETHLKEIRV